MSMNMILKKTFVNLDFKLDFSRVDDEKISSTNIIFN